MIKPMLAYKVGKKPIDWTKKVYMQPKLDGVRCLIRYEKGFNPNLDPSYDDRDKVVAYSRTGKLWLNIEHILESLKPWFEFHPDIILDGELYNHDLRDDFEKIISLVRKQKPTESDRLEAKELVQFHCYDYIETSARALLHNESYSARMNNLVTTDMYSYCVKYVETTRVRCQDSANIRHRYNLNSNYEGSILRLDGPYQRKRSYNLQKFKDFSDAEAFIVGYEEGKGKREGTIGKFIMQDDDGNQFGCPPGKGYNYGDLKCILKNIHQYMGQRATFTFFERTKAGSYRHPLFKTLRNYE